MILRIPQLRGVEAQSQENVKEGRKGNFQACDRGRSSRMRQYPSLAGLICVGPCSRLGAKHAHSCLVSLFSFMKDELKDLQEQAGKRVYS